MRKHIELCAADDCTGCGACINSCAHEAIQMTCDLEGFMHPLINHDKCIGCGLCEKSCPILHNSTLFSNNPAPETYVAWAKSNAIRCNSSSGGIFSVISDYILNNGGIVFGATMEPDHTVRHIAVSSNEDLNRLRGSKYVQSDINNTFKQAKHHLQQGGKVLFTGTPCQIAGLRQFLRKEYDNLFLVDIFCHGVPPQRFLHETTELLPKARYDTSSEISFRDTNGWRCIFQYGEKTVRLNDDIYFMSFMKSLDFREGCYRCPFARLPRQGDLSIGDFWGIGKYTPFKGGDVSKGASCVLVNNDKGKRVWNAVKNTMFREERELSEAKIENPNIYRASTRPKERDTFFSDFKSMSLKAFAKKYHLHEQRPFFMRVLHFLRRKIKI